MSSDDPTLPPPGGDKTRPETRPSLPADAVSDDAPTLWRPGEDEDATLPSNGSSDDDGTLAYEGPTMPSSEGATVPSVGAMAETEKIVVGGGGQSAVFADRFEVVTLLGEGGMGRVYQVHDRQIEGREVALKVLRPRYSRNARFRQLFFQEIRAAQKFVSEHVNQVRDTGQMDDGRLFLTMDLVSGEALNDLLEREHVLNTRHALEVARQMLIALGSGHEQGFVHRDVKPSNVMLAARVAKTDDNPYGVGVRLLDFGIAALAAEVGEGHISGTPMYMSPEQAQGQRLDARSDLFSVGIVLYEMLSGGRPFEGTTLEEVSTSLVETKVAPMIKGLDHLKPAVQKILRRALEKDRDRRFQSAAEFISAIEGSKAYKVPTGVPAWVGGLLVLSLLGAAGEGVYVAYQQTQLDARQESFLAKASELETARENWAARETQLVDEKSDALIAQKDVYDGRIGALQAEVDRLSALVGEQNVAEAKGDLTGTIVEDLQARILSLETRAQQAEDRAEKLREINEQLTVEAAPEAKVARGFDNIVDFIRAGFGADAVKEHDRMVASSVFAAGSFGGREFLGDLAKAGAALESHQDSVEAGSPDDEALFEARRKLDSLGARLPAFKIDSKKWLEHALPLEEAPQRVQALESLLADLGAEASAAYTAYEERKAESFRDIEAGPADQSPQRVIEYGRSRGWDKLTAFFERLGEHLDAAHAGGRLDVAALGRLKVLGAWGEYVAQDGTGVPADLADEIRWLWFAERWYHGDETPLVPADAAPVDGASPHDDWRAELALQVRLAKSSILPEKGAGSFVYRTGSDSGDRVDWTIDNVRVSSGSGESVEWTIDRRPFISQRGEVTSRPIQKVTAGRRGSVFVGTDGTPMLDLRSAGSEVRVATLDLALPESLPGVYGFPKAEFMDEFRARIEERRPLPCLVIDDRSGIVRWFSPGLGLVREDVHGRVRELVYAQP